jgi:hypothetical protein
MHVERLFHLIIVSTGPMLGATEFTYSGDVRILYVRLIQVLAEVAQACSGQKENVQLE